MEFTIRGSGSNPSEGKHLVERRYLDQNDGKNPKARLTMGKNTRIRGTQNKPENLPPNTTIIAHDYTQSYLNIAGYKLRGKPIYGLIFHPESSGENGEIILRNFVGFN